MLEKSKSKWIKEGVINTLIMLVKDGIISVEDAAKRANLSVSTFQKYLNKKCKCFIKAQNNEDTVKGVLFCMALIRLRLCKIKRVIKLLAIKI